MQNKLYRILVVFLILIISNGSIYALTPALYGRIRTLTQQINAGTISEDAARKEVASLNLKSSSSNMNDTKVQELLTVASQHDYKIDDLIVPGVASAPTPTKSVTTTTTTAKPATPIVVKPTARVTSQQVEVNESGVISPVSTPQKVTVPQNQQVQKPAVTQPVQQSQTQFEGEQVIKKLEGVKAGLEKVNMLSVLRDPSTGKRIDERRDRLAYFTTAFNTLDRDTATYSNKFQVTQQNIINTLKKDIVALIKQISDVEAQMLSTEQSQQPISTGTREETTEKVIKDVIKNIQPTATVQKPAVTQPVQQSQQITTPPAVQQPTTAAQQPAFSFALNLVTNLVNKTYTTPEYDKIYAYLSTKDGYGLLVSSITSNEKPVELKDSNKIQNYVESSIKNTDAWYQAGDGPTVYVMTYYSLKHAQHLYPDNQFIKTGISILLEKVIGKEKVLDMIARLEIEAKAAPQQSATTVQKSRDEKIMPEPVAIISGQAQSDDNKN